MPAVASSPGGVNTTDRGRQWVSRDRPARRLAKVTAVFVDRPQSPAIAANPLQSPPTGRRRRRGDTLKGEFLQARVMSDTIQKEKFVELNYRVVDQKTGGVLVTVDYPLGYVHGTNDVLSAEVIKALEGRAVGDVIQVPVDTKLLYGERDESLVFTDRIENVPEEFREVGMVITMENDKGEPRNFIVTRCDDKTLTVDGNNPLCGREVMFELEVLTIRDATDEEIELGGAVGADPDINEILGRA